MGNCFMAKPKTSKQKSNIDTKRKGEKYEIEDNPLSQTKSTNKLNKQQSEKFNQDNQELPEVKINQGTESKMNDIRTRNDKKNKKFLQAILTEDTLTLIEKIIKLDKKVEEVDKEIILSALESHFFFSQLTDQDRLQLIDKMFYCKVPQQSFIFNQGDQASTYFILSKGQCEIIIDGQIRKTLLPGQAFGELALLYNSTRSASVKTIDECYLWGIHRNQFRQAMEVLAQKDFQTNRTFIENIHFFGFEFQKNQYLEHMSAEQKDAITGVMITQQYVKNEKIVNEGDQANSYFIIKSGIVSIEKDGKEIRKMSAGDSFGEQALFQNSVRGATVVAESDLVVCIALGRETLSKILGDHISSILCHNIFRWSFEKHQLFNKLTKIQVERIVNKLQIMEGKLNEILISKGTECNQLISVLQGSLEYGNVIIQKGSFFGDTYLNSDLQIKVLENDLKFQSNCQIAQISFEDFFTCIGGKLEEIVIKNQNSHENKYMRNRKNSKAQTTLQLSDLIYLKNLGAGEFGSVYLVKNMKDLQLYSLKCVKKQIIQSHNLEKHLIQEKEVLEVIDFPFIMQISRTFKDSNHIYFLLEYIKGMELFDVIRDIGLLNTFDSQFYVSSIILCIEYLHTHSIIYRDIKPENIMVDLKGYLKLIDLGTAKFLKTNKTFTIIGTPHYMAPEIITGKGYTFSVDLWSIGVCLYEFMCGGVPFAEDQEDPYQIYEAIIMKQVIYPAFVKDNKAKKLMDQLINKTPELRLGSSFAALKAHIWFDHFDWDKLMDRELKAPYIPPKTKLINDREIKEQEKQMKCIVDEILAQNNNETLSVVLQSKNPDWDQIF